MHAARDAEEGILEDWLRLRAQTIPIGVGLTYATVASFAGWVVATWGAPHRGLIVAMLVLAAVTATCVAALPHERLLRSRWREPFFVGWSFAYVAVITVIAAADGGARSPVTLIFFLTLVFAALSYPFWLVVLVSAADVGAFLLLAIAFPTVEPTATVSPSSIWLFATCLTLVALMCIWQSRVNVRHLRRLGRLSRSDALTGCLNRFGFGERLAAELERGRRDEAPVGLVLLDLVGFKAVNDTHGHPAGDELLVWVGHALRTLVRPGDAVGRLGGDEFALVLVGSDGARAEEVARRVRRTLAERIEATTGAASAPDDGWDAAGLVRAADARLYAGRRPGAPLVH
jgi:diguanylate cyclase (GGDEF)-like protein